MPEFTPQLDERLTAEFLAHTLQLLVFPFRQTEAMLDTSAFRFESPEPPRDPDLPMLAPKAYPHPGSALVEEAMRSLFPPPAVDGFVGRRAELDQAVLSLLSDHPVVITGDQGAGKTTLLRQIAHDPRIRKHFRRVWWLDDLDLAGATVGLALNAPGVLRADPADQPRLAREFLVAAGTLLLVDNATDGQQIEWALRFSPTMAIASAVPHGHSAATPVHVGALTPDAATEYLSRLAGLPANESLSLAQQVDFRPGALRVIAALIREDGISPETVAGFLKGLDQTDPGDRPDPLIALYRASLDALPEAYQVLCSAFAASPRQWIAVETVLASYEKNLVGQRALTFIERRNFVERQGDNVRVLGPWPTLIPAAPAGFAPIPRPAAHIGGFGGNTEAIAQGQAYHTQGVTWIEAGNDAEAEAALNQALALRQTNDSDHAIAETLVALARLAYLRGDDPAAIRRLESAAERLHELRDDESLEVVRVALSRVYRRAGRLDAALSVLGDDAPPEDLIAVYSARQEWPEAIAVYDKWAGDMPDWVRLALSETCAMAGRYDQALEVIAQDNSFDAWWLRGMIYHLQGDIQKAHDIYMRIRADVPSAVRASYARAYARALATLGEIHDAAMIVGAEGIWYEAKQHRPIFARQRISHALHAHFNLMLGKIDEAEEAARRALSIPGERPDPEADAIVHRVLGRVAWSRGHLANALAEFELELTARGSMVRRDDHESGVTLHMIADIQRERGELDRAIANYRRALTHKDPARDWLSVLLTRLTLRETLIRVGRQADAFEAGQEAVELVLRHPGVDLQMLGYTMTLHVKVLADSDRGAKANQLLNNWILRLAKRVNEGVEHPYWGVRALATGLCLRTLALTNALVFDDPITLIDLAEHAVETAEAEVPGTWVAWAARRDLGNLYLRLERWTDACEVFAPLLADSEAAPGLQAPFVTLAGHLGSARAFASLGQIDDAIRHFDAALPYEPDPHTCGLIVREAAEMYRTTGDDAHAAERYIQALGFLSRDKAPAIYIDTIVTLAYTRLRLRRFNEAIDTFQDAITIVEQMPKADQGLMASVLFDMATAHHTLGQYRRAAETYQRSLSYQDMRRAPERYVETLIALARSHVAQEAYQPALEAYHDALQFDLLDDNQRRALLCEQAEVFVRIGLAHSAVDAFRAALAIEGGSSVERAAIHRGLGALYSELNDHDKARTHFQSALDFVQDEQTGLTLQALGDAYRAQGQLPEAIQAYDRALAQLSRAANPVELAATERALGEIYLGFEQPNEALAHLESALEIERALPQQNGGRIVHTLQSAAQAHERRRELELAIRRHHQALVYQDVRHDPDGYINTLRTLGRLYAQMKHYGEATKAYEEALATEMRQPKPDLDRIDAISGALADVYRVLGRLEEAAALYQQVTDKAVPGGTDFRARAVESMKANDADIARHLETLRAAEQSWTLLNRVAKPDIKGLAFVRALQAQTSAALGRREASDQYLDQLVQLLKRRRNEVQPDDPRSIMRALAMLLRALDYEETGHPDTAEDAYARAVEIAEHDTKSDGALVWAIRRRAEQASTSKR